MRALSEDQIELIRLFCKAGWCNGDIAAAIKAKRDTVATYRRRLGLAPYLLGKANKRWIARMSASQRRRRQQQQKPATLEPLAIYPDPSRRQKCDHGKLDGECPACERIEREKLHLETTNPLES